MLVFLIQKVVQIASDFIVAFSVKPLGKPLHERFFAVDVQAEEIDRLIKTQPLLISFGQTVIDISAVKRD